MEHQGNFLTPDDSANGRLNACYIRCKQVGFCRPYAACIQSAKNITESLGRPEVTPCENSIRAKTCPAISMRKEELEKGRAVYFEPRFIPSEGVGLPESVIDSIESKKALTNNREELLLIPTPQGSYADAINNFNQTA